MEFGTVLVLLLGLMVGAAVVGLATRSRLRQRDAFQALAAEALRLYPLATSLSRPSALPNET